MATNRPMNFWVVVKRAPDLPGWWIAHCLDIDVLSQGDSLQDALESIPEAVRIAVMDDLQMGREPLRRRAPDEYWAELAEIQRQGNPLFLTPDALHKQSPEIDALAVQLRVSIMTAVPSVREVPWMWAQPQAMAV